MTPPRHQIVTAMVFLTLIVAAFSLLATESVTVAAVASVALWASLWVHSVLHEVGHLAAALLVRMPVVAVRIAPFTGWRNEVLVRPSPAAAAVRARMVSVLLGGALANLGTAAVLVLLVPRFTIGTQIVLVEAAAVAVLLGVGNLVPGASHDGTFLRLWLTRPADMREGLWAGRFREEVGRILRPLDPGDVASLAAYLDKHHQPSAGHEDHSADLLADAERLRDLPGADPAIAQVLSIQFGLWYLYAAAVTRAPVDHEEVVEIGELARRALRARPDQPASTIAMGLAELLAGRPKRARSALVEVSAGDLHDIAILLRAAAGDPVPGDAGRYPELLRVVRAVRDAGPDLAMSRKQAPSQPVEAG